MSQSRRDPICGMTGVFERHGFWFCSEKCARDYAETKTGDRETSISFTKRLLDPWVWVPLSIVLMASIGSVWSGLQPLSLIYQKYAIKVLPPFFIGLLIGGIIDHFIPKEYIIRLLAGERKRVIGRATLLGFLASTCSHGCLALAIELYRKGASIPAVVSFLLASPWASMSFTLIILNLFGIKGAAIIGWALIISFLTGLIFQRLASRHLIDSNPNTTIIAEEYSIRKDIAKRFKEYQPSRTRLAANFKGVMQGTIPLGRMVLGWVQFGLLLSALLGTFVSHEVFTQYFGPSLAGLLMTMLAATVIEVCSEGTAPVAFELYRQTGALGNAFAFLMGGVVTDYTELAAFWKNIGRRTVVWMLLVTLPLVIGVGWILNQWK